MIEVKIVIAGPITSSLVCRKLDATIKPDGYSVKAECVGWWWSPDGSVHLSIKADEDSPEGLLPACDDERREPIGGRAVGQR